MGTPLRLPGLSSLLTWVLLSLCVPLLGLFSADGGKWLDTDGASSSTCGLIPVQRSGRGLHHECLLAGLCSDDREVGVARPAAAATSPAAG